MAANTLLCEDCGHPESKHHTRGDRTTCRTRGCDCTSPASGLEDDAGSPVDARRSVNPGPRIYIG